MPWQPQQQWPPVGHLNEPPLPTDLVLAGPMLRRVDQQSVAVFVALSKPRDVRLRVFDAGGQVIEETATTVTLGSNLHVLVIEAKTVSGTHLEPGEYYTYNVEFWEGSTSTDLESEGLLTGDLALGYTDLALPGFRLPETLESLRVVHGSCRKPHGGKDDEPDMLAELDTILEEARTGTGSVDNEPNLLLLTGDQIYADDVPIVMADVITRRAFQLMGWDETLPVDNGPGFALGNENVRPGKRRGDLTAGKARLTSKHVDGHLLYFAEFCAMYLMAWSPVIWPKDDLGNPTLPLVDDVLTNIKDHCKDEFLRSNCAKSRDNYTAVTTKKAAEKERDHSKIYAHQIGKVRRALANIPTMMIFDDHEITDDWNLHLEWAASGRSNPTARRVQRNGLLAYAIFQDWGNQPQRYTTDHPPLSKLAWAAPDPALPMSMADHDTTLDGLLDHLNLGDDPRHSAATARAWHWSFSWDWISMQVRALDTRTHREFPTTGVEAGAGLITAESLDEQLSDIASSAKVHFVISGAPVVGVPMVETAQQLFRVIPEGPAAGDNEPWNVNGAAYLRLIDRLAPLGNVVVLSGDVHYAFANRLDDYSPAGNSRLVQLCSSSLHNSERLSRTLGSKILDVNPALLGDMSVIETLVFENGLSNADRVRLTQARDAHREQLRQEAIDNASSSFITTDYGIDRRANSTTQFVNTVDSRVMLLWAGLDLKRALESPAFVSSVPWKHFASETMHNLAQATQRAWRIVFAVDSEEWFDRAIVGHNNLGVLRVEVTSNQVSGLEQRLLSHRDGSSGVQDLVHFIPMGSPPPGDNPIETL